MAKFSKFLLENLELVLAGMSIPVIVLVHFLISRHFDDPWKVTAAAAVAVGVLHGFLGWMVRGRQRSVRLELLQRVAVILQRDVALENTRQADPASRLALAQLPALMREPLVVKHTARPELNVLHGQRA